MSAGPGWSVHIDRDVCMGAGVCVMYAPGTFTHDDDTKAVLRDASTDDIATVRTAVGACPTGALTFHEGA